MALATIAALVLGDVVKEFCQACISDGTGPDPYVNLMETDWCGDGEFEETLEEQLEELIEKKFPGTHRKKYRFWGLIDDGGASAPSHAASPICFVEIFYGLLYGIRYVIRAFTVGI